MKNFKRIVILIFCLFSIKANAQLTAWTKNIETEIQHNGYIGFYEAKNICSIKTTDNSIISVFNFKENDNEYFNKKQFRYDSVAISKVDFNGNIIWIKKYSIPNSGRIEDVCE
ncbi:MAG: hypothetical protein IPL21_14340 [Saprospirales bacterium]|nr:hypothetical protein [Saprospirales bacterium]